MRKMVGWAIAHATTTDAASLAKPRPQKGAPRMYPKSALGGDTRSSTAPMSCSEALLMIAQGKAAPDLQPSSQRIVKTKLSDVSRWRAKGMKRVGAARPAWV